MTDVADTKVVLVSFMGVACARTATLSTKRNMPNFLAGPTTRD